MIRERANWDTLARDVADVTFLARQQGVLDSPWTVHLFDTGSGTFMTLDPSGGWELGDGGRTVYASSKRPGVCQATNAIVARVRFALIEALKH